jgi:hypothetical protein
MAGPWRQFAGSVGKCWVALPPDYGAVGRCRFIVNPTVCGDDYRSNVFDDPLEPLSTFFSPSSNPGMNLAHCRAGALG